MSYSHRLVLMLVLAFVPLASACEILDNSCPEGYWRPRAMEDCVPLPLPDAGRDSGSVVADAGTDAGSTSDGAAADGAAADGATADGAASDAAIDAASSDAAASDAALLPDAALPDAALP